ncbi:2-hydroxyacyl-CoA dehydratase family protein [Myxococcota bacterium]|nr:2-hydroxyacyl-CoA dehydratase family protein [Myxococcota bacterium]MBU1380314.1 2-hydroxyacyl-CoA dehydratase family protein [Myxococcota bacterium]MBU1495302.1 2-hydroxyacyl-CoA dehydratase family protein [Myxococcota bacterium]
MELKPYEIIKKIYYASVLANTVFKAPRTAWWLLKASSAFMYEKETLFNRSNRFGFQKIGSSFWTPEELDAYRHDSLATSRVYGRLLKAAENKTPVVWLDWPVPIEIVKGFDVAAYVPESFMIAANIVGTDGHVACLEAVERAGIADDICAMDRITIGAWLTKQIPPPAAIIAVAHPCDAGRTTNQILEYMTGAPAFTINTSYTKNDEDVMLYSKNLFEAIEFLEDILKMKFNWQKFEEMVHILNKHNYYLNEITAMNQNIPSPGLAYSLQAAWLSKIPCAGDPDIMENARKIYEIAKKSIQNPEHRHRKEKFRIIVADMPIVFTELFKWIENSFGGVVVSDYIGDAIYPEIDTSSRESMMMGVARDRLYAGMIKQAHGKASETIDDLERQISQFSADCVIFNGHQGCRHNRALSRMVKDVCARHKIPSLMMEADIFDKRVMSEEKLKKELTDFFRENGFA